MTFYLFTNRTAYFNDLSEIVRLFIHQVDIVLPENDIYLAPEDLSVHCTIERAGKRFTGCALLNDSEQTVSLETDDLAPMNVKCIEKRLMKIALFRAMKQRFDTATPWGSLTGIRPTKLFRDMENAVGRETAYKTFSENYDVEASKISLLEEITDEQRETIRSADEHYVDIYVNIPFCVSKCLYCSFPSEIISSKKDVLTPYLQTLYMDIEQSAALIADRGYTVRATYIGGGTPTVLDSHQLGDLLKHIHSAYGTFGCELTVEAGRPDTIDERKLAVMAKAGVNRISINPQTMNDKTLQSLGRLHSSVDIIDTYRLARSFGFKSINMDLICGLPGEEMDDFKNSILKVAELLPDNLTVHTLALKRSSRLIEHQELYPMADADTVERMVHFGYETAERIGMKPYYMYRQKYMNGNLENVGYALPGMICVYNIDMMEETTNIIAHGANGMSKRVFLSENRVERIPNPKDIRTYVEKLPVVIQQKRELF